MQKDSSCVFDGFFFFSLWACVSGRGESDGGSGDGGGSVEERRGVAAPCSRDHARARRCADRRAENYAPAPAAGSRGRGTLAPSWRVLGVVACAPPRVFVCSRASGGFDRRRRVAQGCVMRGARASIEQCGCCVGKGRRRARVSCCLPPSLAAESRFAWRLAQHLPCTVRRPVRRHAGCSTRMASSAVRRMCRG